MPPKRNKLSSPPMRNKVVNIDIGANFSRYPAGRTPSDGRYSGEAFRERFLKNNLAEGNRIIIVLDNALSYGSSFLEEAFGGLVRKYKYSAQVLKDSIEFTSKDPFLVEEIWSYVEDADRKAAYA